MHLTVLAILALIALLTTIAAALNPPRCPIWIPVFILSLFALISVIPTR